MSAVIPEPSGEGRLDERMINAIHTIDDLCKENARLRRSRREARDILRDVPHAITHGALNVAEEYVDRALTMLSKEI